MAGWNYYNPVEIVFGNGSIDSLGAHLRPNRAVLVTTPGSSSRGLVDYFRKRLGKALVGVYDGIQSHPTCDDMMEVSSSLRGFEYDVVIALGGGSAIDSAKALVAMDAAENPEWLRQHLQRGVVCPASFRPKPVIAIPTTAGTGSEVTSWATVWDREAKRKYSLSHRLLYPKMAILDPQLTLSLPEKETLYGGLDALSHAMEAVWNKNYNPVSDALASTAISLIFSDLPKLRSDLKNLALREGLLRASLLAGLSFSNTKTALAHSISYPLTTVFGLPHGLACSVPLVQVIRRLGDSFPERMQKIASSLGCRQDSRSVAEKVEGFFAELGVPLQLHRYGVGEEELKASFTEFYCDSERGSNFIVPIDGKGVLDLVMRMHH